MTGSEVLVSSWDKQAIPLNTDERLIQRGGQVMNMERFANLVIRWWKCQVVVLKDS